MLSFIAAASSSISSRILQQNPNPRFTKLLRSSSSSLTNPLPDENPTPIRPNHAGVRLDQTVQPGTKKKTRLDQYLSSQIAGVSRARIQSTIKSGLVSINGQTINKPSSSIKEGDRIACTVSQLQALTAKPENIPIHIVYEDAHVLVVNKPPHMVVHPAPGNPSGTLVNAVLHHCSLPNIVSRYKSSSSEDEEDEEDEEEEEDEMVRPGIVHRLDKGTSGLLVIAKDELSHSKLSEQFKNHTIERVYVSLTCGAPNPGVGRVEIPIARDPINRIRMAAVIGMKNSKHVRYAASKYRVMEVLGGVGLVQWRLETGRTHQIRAHARYLGVPLVGDDLYGGGISKVLSLIEGKKIKGCDVGLERPMLHALSLGFVHPITGQFLKFECKPPEDFLRVLRWLRGVSGQSEEGKVKVMKVGSTLLELGCSG